MIMFKKCAKSSDSTKDVRVYLINQCMKCTLFPANVIAGIEREHVEGEICKS